MTRLFILLLLCLFFLTLNFSNSHSLVSLNYFFGVTTGPVPVAWLVSGVFAAGMVLGWLFTLPAWVRLKLELRRVRKAQDQMETDFNLQHGKTLRTEGLNISTPSDPDEI